MINNNRGTYKKNDSFKEVNKGCIGRTLKFGVVIILLLILASISVPSERRMKEAVINSSIICVMANLQHAEDESDDIVRNIKAMVTSVDPKLEKSLTSMKFYHQLNTIKIYPHALYSTASIHNVAHPSGTRVAIGIFGIIIPTVSMSDFLLRTDVIRKEYKNGEIIVNKPAVDTETEHLYDDDYNPYELGKQPRDLTPLEEE